MFQITLDTLQTVNHSNPANCYKNMNSKNFQAIWRLPSCLITRSIIKKLQHRKRAIKHLRNLILLPQLGKKVSTLKASRRMCVRTHTIICSQEKTCDFKVPLSESTV